MHAAVSPTGSFRVCCNSNPKNNKIWKTEGKEYKMFRDDINEVWAKLYEEIDELKIACEKGQLKSIEEEIGDCFFSLVNLARHLNISAENSVRKTNNKFSKRFKEVELKVSKMGKKINEMSNEEISKLYRICHRR